MAEITEKDLEQISGGAYSGPCFKYTIQWGDTLSALALKYHTTVATLAQINNIPNPDVIKAGATIYIPWNGDIVYV